MDSLGCRLLKVQRCDPPDTYLFHFDNQVFSCIYLCMATKTVSIDEEAYRKLVRARRHARESFSQVIHRAHWSHGVRCCGDLLDRASGIMPEAALERLDQAQRDDREPEDKWAH